MAGRQKRIVGNAKEDWWRSSEYNAKMNLDKSLASTPKNPLQGQKKAKRIMPNVATAEKNTLSEKRIAVNESKRNQMKKTANTKKWEDEYRKASNKWR